jgi:hypothetical protein
MTDVKEDCSPPRTVQDKTYPTGNSSTIYTVHCIEISISCYTSHQGRNKTELKAHNVAVDTWVLCWIASSERFNLSLLAVLLHSNVAE